jgi:hypothetical protein
MIFGSDLCSGRIAGAGGRCNPKFLEFVIYDSRWPSRSSASKKKVAFAMTPQPPSPSEGSSLPPRHRPTLGSLIQDTTELDLWAFDEEEGAPDEHENPQPTVLTPRSSVTNVPAPRVPLTNKPLASEDASRPAAGEELIRINVNKQLAKNRPVVQLTGPATPEGEFDDLEQWDHVPHQAQSPPAPVIAEPVRQEPVVVAEPPVAVVPEPPSVPSASAKPDDDEFNPVVRENAVPISLRPRLKLSGIERVGLISLLALILAGGGGVLVISMNRLPSETKRVKANDFPIQGKHLTIASAQSYWRAPVLEGSSLDTVRRGTQLLPVLEITVTGGPAAIRVLFRNEDRAVVGDAVSRTVTGGGTLKIPATAGFDNLGMHAAYRTGESKPWTIEVLEAASEDTTGKGFKKLFELNISTDRR